MGGGRAASGGVPAVASAQGHPRTDPAARLRARLEMEEGRPSASRSACMIDIIDPSGAGPDMGEEAKVAIVSGASSGIGLEAALLLSGSGYAVYGCSRSPEKIKAALASRGGAAAGGVKAVKMDVGDSTSVNNAVANVLDERGRIDTLVNCAGYAQIGAIEDMTVGDMKRNMDTNFFGTVRVIKAVVPAMRRQGGGRIVNVSAVAGRTGFAFVSAYVASKFAVEGLTESLRHELRRFGIRVSAVEPGVVRTDFHSNMKMSKGQADSVYKGMAEKIVSNSALLYERGTEPDVVARVILDVIADPEPGPRYTAGEDAKVLMDEKARRSDVEFERYVDDIFGDVVNLG